MKRTQGIYAGMFAIISLVGIPNEVKAQTQTIYNTSMPSVIRVAIRPNNDPWGPILWVQTVGFKEYCSDVLPNEWMPSWSPESLRAGAIAIKMYAWYCTLHPTKEEGWTYDVDNTTNFQQYKFLSGMYVTDRAIDQTWNLVYVPENGEIRLLEYRSGFPDSPNWEFIGRDIMSQWGSQYWGSIARLTYPQILNMFYPGFNIRDI